MQLPRDTLLRLWRTMVRIRAFEERLILENRKGGIAGHLHLYIGQEAIATGVCAHLTDEDAITSTHRGHGHALAKGCDANGMMAEIFGRATGSCAGKGGSMHIADPKRGHLGANGIVGANAPLALGAALSAKTLGTHGVSVAFIGDGASNQGAVFESMNMAAAMALPVLFVIEQNGYGEYTRTDAVTGTADLAARAASFGMPAQKIDGTDIFAVYDAAQSAIHHARTGLGPTTLVATAPRFGGHYEGDNQAYRSASDMQKARDQQDCLALYRNRILEAGLLEARDLDAIVHAAHADMEHAAQQARADAPPAPATLLTDIYAKAL
ncbi:ABC transporter substrate-binding protein [Iodidimonas gelatinilytica]|uniref:ABC transporter substrate-binding protein n=1 Tax=Iodidimonas gelatinilytica TaxID=1236966 RepID=A0A5A7MYS4_9PROT|nr:thiamine pyrophosphate-dependent dehydrogenase E1 component subunit alpha [Iodidimonas gelatinilytica]GER01241.1 ABC transporter substrate-binding protein [Iodidimonas gelatinilytica]